MAERRGMLSWILLVVVLIVGFFVGRSIWYSLRDTRAELERQKQKTAELEKRDQQMRAYVDSLNQVLARLEQEERRLLAERNELERRLQSLQREYRSVLARLDSVWEAGAVIAEVEAAYPHWRGQIREATRADGVHALIAPRFFGADAAETKIKLDKSVKEMAVKDSVITNLDQTLSVKNEQVRTLMLKADTLQSNYDNVFAEYKVLDKKYQDLLKKKWFTLNFSPGNILTGAAGFAAGYGVGYLRYKD